MRISLLMCASLAAAAPAAAQPAPIRPIEIPPGLTDPATMDMVAEMVGALGDALLELPVGGIQAAVEGREPTPREKALTVRDLGRRDDPNFERNLELQIAQAKPVIQHGMRAMAEALPAVTEALSDVAIRMERAIENMPRPDYPRR